MKKVKRIFPWLVAVLLLAGCGSEGKKGEADALSVNKEAVYRESENFLQLPEGENISAMLLVGDTLYTDQFIYSFVTGEGIPTEEITVTPPASGWAKEEEIEEASEEALEENPEADVEEVLEEEAVIPSEEIMEEEAAIPSEEIMEEETENLEGEAYPGDMENSWENVVSTVTRRITAYDLQGNEKSRVEISMSGNENNGGIAIDEKGNMYTLITTFATYEGDDVKDKVYLKAYDKNGGELWSIFLNENLKEEEYFYANQVLLGQEGQLLLDTSRGIEIYDAMGQPIRLIEKPDAMDCSLKKLREGKFAFVYSNGEKAHIQVVDIASGNLQEKIEIPFNYFRYSVQNGLYYDLYLSDEYGVYGYNIGDTEPQKLMDYISSDFGGNVMYQLVFLDENTFLGSYYREEGMIYSKFTKVPASEVGEKTDLTLGCYYLDPKVKQKLVDFNKNNPGYKIHIMDYSVYDTANDYTQGLTKLNTDIISGNLPDIMLLDQRMPVNSYISKGLFADYNEFMEKDTEFRKENFLPNILEALSSEDGLYQLAPAFTVTTFAAKTKHVGEKPGWTMDQATDLLNSLPEDTKLLSDMTSSSLLYNITWIGIDEYVDWENGKCYFDTPGFISLLEYAKTLPEEIDYGTMMDDESYWNEMEVQYRNDKTILSMLYISGFRDYQYAKQGTFGEDITLIGFPGERGIGAGLAFNTKIAISALSKNQDIAWEFVKGFFSEEYQDSVEYEFPVRLSSLEKLEELAWSRPFYEDEEGNREEYDETFQLNGVEIILQPLTKEETGALKEYLGSVTNVAIPNEDIYNIILEETASYFSGQKSARDVADIIQSRVKIYVNENR